MKPIRNSASYFAVLYAAMRQLGHSDVDQIAVKLLRAYDHGRSIYILGNGGSAATASHFACDLGKGTTKWLTRVDKRFRVIALTDNVPVMTAWANDSDYEDIFAEQIRNLVRPNDVVLAISGSGNSPNVIKALEIANRHGAHTIGLAGFRRRQNEGVMPNLPGCALRQHGSDRGRSHGRVSCLVNHRAAGDQ